MFVDNKPKVELSLSGINKEEVATNFDIFINDLNSKNISYTLRH